ncbi:MAG: hypothetical protein NZ480_04155 [Bdellovibrionaceae bacterium]|nr:hypothetical protein [Pseudobdellovibrionaceae bacterium]
MGINNQWVKADFLKRRTQGIVLIGLLISVSVLFSLMILNWGHFQVIQFVRKQRSQCRTELLGTQQHLKEKIDAILLLNHKLRYFRLQKHIAEGLIASGKITVGKTLYQQAVKGLKSVTQLQNSLIQKTEMWWQGKLAQINRIPHSERKIYEIKVTSSAFYKQPALNLPLVREIQNDPFSDIVVKPEIETALHLIKVWKHKYNLLPTIPFFGGSDGISFNRPFACQVGFKWVSKDKIEVTERLETPKEVENILFF